MLKSVRFTTRTLLYCAVFAGLQALLYLALSPGAVALATVFPPAYALLAGAYSSLTFAARLFIGITGSATLTSALAGALVAAASPVGLIVLIPFMISGLTFDVVLRIGSRGTNGDRPLAAVLLAALISAILLFAVSLPVFSADDLAAEVLAMTFLGRLLGQVAAALIARAIVTALARAGVRPIASQMRPDTDSL